MVLAAGCAVLAAGQTSAGIADSAQTPTEAADKPITLTPKQAKRVHQLMNDWAQLQRYHDADEQMALPTVTEQRVVFLGDSITDNWGRKYGDFFPGKPYVNRGISGQTTPQMLIRFQQDVIALRPSAVLILAGINDIAGNTGRETLDQVEDNFRSMVMLAKAAHIRVILASTLPASTLPWRPSVQPTEQVKKLNKWLESFAKKEELVFCNYYPAMANAAGGIREELAVDKAVHPNAEGYAVMAPIAEAAIAKSLSGPRP